MNSAMMAEFTEHADQAAHLLKQLANTHRLMILCSLLGQEMTVGELNQVVSLSQSALSQHLANLREAGLVAAERDGQRMNYRITHPVVASLIETLKSYYCPNL